MKTTAWLSKRLAIINQFQLVKSDNRFNKARLVRKYVHMGVNWTAHTPYAKTTMKLYIQPTDWQMRAQERYWACSSTYVCASVLLTSTTGKSLLIRMQPFSILPCTLWHAQWGSWVFAMHLWACFSVSFFLRICFRMWWSGISASGQTTLVLSTHACTRTHAHACTHARTHTQHTHSFFCQLLYFSSHVLELLLRQG